MLICRKNSLDCGNTSHLHRCLEGTTEEETAERGARSEQLHVRLGLMLMLKGDGLPNLVVFRDNPRVVLVAMCMEFGEGLQSLFVTSMVNKPTG
jgi:hypothetical protein